MNRVLLVTAVCLISPFRLLTAHAAEPQEIVLWPEGVPEPRVTAEPAEKVEKKADGIARRSNVSNPRLVVYNIPQTEPRSRARRAWGRFQHPRRRT